MTLKEISEHFIVDKEDKNKYFLRSKTEHGVFPYKYLCTITKINHYTFQVENLKPTSNVKELVGLVNDHVQSLGYDSEFFNPKFREGYKYELFIYRLLEKNGFNYSDCYTTTNYKSEHFTNDNKNIYGGKQTLHLTVTYSEKIEFELSTGVYSGISVSTKKHFKDIEEAFIGLMKPLFLGNGISNIKKAEELGEINSDIEYILSEIKGFDVKKTDYKTTLKNKLIELANSL